MPKQPIDLRTLASITRQLDALTDAERLRVLDYIEAKYAPPAQEAVAK